MDQGAGLLLGSKQGEIFVMIGRQLPAGTTANAYPLADPDE